MNTVEQLKAAILQLRAAAKAEGIEPGSTLGIWMSSQEMTLMVMADTVEWQVGRLEGRLEQMKEAADAAVVRVDAEIANSRAVTRAAQTEIVLCRERTRESEEVRKVENQALARELGKEIATTVQSATVAREVRFNRRQNWSAVALVSGLYFSMFLGGAIWDAYRSDNATLERCIQHQQSDASGKVFWCSMDMVRGGP